MLQNGGDIAEALRHFDAAEKTKLQRPLLRQMQLGGMFYQARPEIPGAVMRVANAMRIDREPLEGRMGSRILTYFRPGNEDDLQRVLTAVSPTDAWATFLWLDEDARRHDGTGDDIHREYIHARVLELEGKTSEAREILTQLDKRMRSERLSGRLADDIAAALKRLQNVPTPRAPDR